MNASIANPDATAAFSGASCSAIGYPRDFSFYCRSHGGSARKYHGMGHDLRSKCGRVRMLNADDGRPINEVPAVLRCKVCWPNNALCVLTHSKKEQ